MEENHKQGQIDFYSPFSLKRLYHDSHLILNHLLTRDHCAEHYREVPCEGAITLTK